MKRLMTSLVVVLSVAAISFGTTVNVPVGAPSWWNSEDGLYVYLWSGDIVITDGVSFNYPQIDAEHWASDYLVNTDFSAVVTDGAFHIVMGNEYHADLTKQIYVYITGTAVTSTVGSVEATIDTDSSTEGTIVQTWGIVADEATGTCTWFLKIEGYIDPQPDYVMIDFTVPGLTSVTGFWVGELCVPEPATIAMLLLGTLGLKRAKKA